MNLNIFDSMIDIVEINKIGLSGMTDEFFGVYINKLLSQNKKSILVVTSTLYEANQLYNSISNYTDSAYLFPMDDFLTSEAIAISPDLMVTRLETINSILTKDNCVVVTNLMGYLRYLPTKEVYQSNIISLVENQEIDPKILAEKLYNMGYNRESIVTKTGEFAVRGFVIDIFPLGENNPIRIEFFGDTIESIRIFDEENQKSIKEIKSISLYPYSEFILDKNKDHASMSQKYLKQLSEKVDSIYTYLNSPVVIYKDYSQLLKSYEMIEKECFNYRQEKDNDFFDDYMFSFLDMNPSNLVHLLTIDNILEDKSVKILNFECKEISQFHENIEVINNYFKEQLYLNKKIIVCLKDYQVKNFVKVLEVPYILTDENNYVSNHVNIIQKNIGNGFSYKDYIVISDKDLFSSAVQKKKYKTQFKYSSKIKDINKLSIGDYVVHNVHGIGIYNGIKTLNVGTLVKDYLEVLYTGRDKLYIPVEKIDLISKYSGKEGIAPKVNKLGGTEWQKIKARVRNKVRDIADKLIKLYAERELKQGYAFQKDTDLQEKFESSFEYTETKDQLLAINQIKHDMESVVPMDRLLCGDVGYGKTEVAFRAMFKAVMDSKQVLYLCPTTILSNQHYHNALKRFAAFPVKIALLNRFTTQKEKNVIIDGLRDGTIDIVIGTHRLLSNDIKPKDLGLLVIDEEQRFGVAHKEKLKEYKTNIDVLTLSATPIPRTLQMSMVGIRSLSLIETPPVDRYPVQTYVIEENKQIIKDAIYKEMSRNGQVFLLYNRVETIEEKALEIQRLVPDARIICAHGQLSKEEIESRMLDFIDQKYDILLCTTIIETGIDIPNVNTLIILDADRFGLSQLYQIRGRVGRSNKIAYAYLMYKPEKVLTETAVKRLKAIKDFTELGSGFSIATRDLSIRGAGDILGSEQAGFIDSVGIELYLKILNEEVERLKGNIPKEEELLTEKPLLDVSTHISDNYTDDDNLKIEIHKKINQIDSYEKLLLIKEELEDRFGKIDETMLIYMYEEWFEKMAKNLEIEKVNKTRNSLELVFSEHMTKNIDGERLFRESFKITPMFRFKMLSNQLIVVLDTIKLEKHYIYYLVQLLEVLLKQ